MEKSECWKDCETRNAKNRVPPNFKSCWIGAIPQQRDWLLAMCNGWCVVAVIRCCPCSSLFSGSVIHCVMMSVQCLTRNVVRRITTIDTQSHFVMFPKETPLPSTSATVSSGPVPVYAPSTPASPVPPIDLRRSQRERTSPARFCDYVLTFILSWGPVSFSFFFFIRGEVWRMRVHVIKYHR